MKATVKDIIAGRGDLMYVELLASYGRAIVVKHTTKQIIVIGEEYEYSPDDVIAEGVNDGLVIDRCKRQIEQMRSLITN